MPCEPCERHTGLGWRQGTHLPPASSPVNSTLGSGLAAGVSSKSPAQKVELQPAGAQGAAPHAVPALQVQGRKQQGEPGTRLPTSCDLRRGEPSVVVANLAQPVLERPACWQTSAHSYGAVHFTWALTQGSGMSSVL